MAAGRDQWLARPGAGVTYALVFGAVGDHPLVAYAISAALVCVAAELVRRFLVRVEVPPALALATALVWVALPSHGSLLYWPSAANITVALVLLLAGLSVRGRWTQPLLLAASVLCYEATLPAALLGVAVVDRVDTGAWRRTRFVRALPFLSAAAAWIAIFFHPAKRGIDRTADLTLMLPAHFGWGVLAWRPLANAAGVAVAVGCTIVIARRRPLGVEGWMLVGGIITVVVGTLPFVRYFYAPLGAGDRVNVVAAVGAALVWTSLGAIVWRLSRAVTVAVACVLTVGAAAEQWEASRAWDLAATDASCIVRALEHGATVVVQPPVRRNVAGMLDASNVDAAADLAAGSRDAEVELVRPASSPRPRSAPGASAARDGSPPPWPCSARRS